MKRFLKWTAIFLAVLLAVIVVAYVLEPTLPTHPRPPSLPD